MNEPRRMIVTVGTSLFYSASWVKGPPNPGNPLDRVIGYEHWTRPPLRDSPSGRRSLTHQAGNHLLLGANIEASIKKLLLHGPASSVDPFFAANDLEHPGRFSAEISTILALWRRERRTSAAPAELHDFLHARYSTIGLLCADDSENEATCCALRLACYIRRLGGRGEALRELASGSTEQAARSLSQYLLAGDPSEPVDLVLSGGYKVFAIVAGAISWQRPKWRVFYSFEDDPTLVEQSTVLGALGESGLELLIEQPREAPRPPIVLRGRIAGS